MTPYEIEALADAIAARLSDAPGADALLCVNQAAELLGCSVPTVERAVRRGEIPSIRIGRLRRYRRADLLGLNRKGGAAHE